MTRPAVAVVGGGAWGLALAAAAGRTGAPTYLFSRRAGSNGKSSAPERVEALASLEEVGKKARLIVLAIPSDVAHLVVRELGRFLDGRHLIVHGIRGLAGDGLERVSEIVRRESAVRRIGAVGGPALAEDLAAGRPSLLGRRLPFSGRSRAVRRGFHQRSAARLRHRRPSYVGLGEQVGERDRGLPRRVHRVRAGHRR